jgi:hypothetical protein
MFPWSGWQGQSSDRFATGSAYICPSGGLVKQESRSPMSVTSPTHQIDPELLEYIEEEQRAQLEEHAQSLKKLKSEVQDKIEKEGTAESSSYSEGVHAAIEDMVKAMKTMANFLSPKKNQAS